MTYAIKENLKSVDEVLHAFSMASEDFDATLLAEFLNIYPQYKDRLLAYAATWLNCSVASETDIANLEVPPLALLKAQSKLLQIWDKAFSVSQTESLEKAEKTLSGFVGASGLRDFSFGLFKYHDEELEPLAMELLDGGISDIPLRYLNNLGETLGCQPSDVSRVFTKYHSQSAQQTYHSSSAKPKVSAPRTWSDVVNELDISVAKKAELLKSE
ncbi:hypothetical protein [Rhodoferax mekongensis]|uniref:Uncharacterized protein n=1 Tax=Rhodoferax mekongensis TaxID=3068341 RepID=A0ABZ0AWW5_9BURK|nr:hypothetical protein [Rhodoferax sp. TBRC 17307]WNO04000.1 hypothetical protein RAN89_13920 [Rhodoferax sp. TBRC 17307]